jgi:hypothetical protein
MRLPVCVFDLESDMLCPNCQERLDNGEIAEFDVEFSKWILEKAKDYPGIDNIVIRRAIKTTDRLILIVKKRTRDVLLSAEGLVNEMNEAYGSVMVFEAPIKLRNIIRTLIHPAIEVGVNSLFLPTGVKESIVMLRPDDRERISYTKEQLRDIVSSVVGESVLFQYQDEGTELEETEPDEFDERMMEFGQRRR